MLLLVKTCTCKFFCCYFCCDFCLYSSWQKEKNRPWVDNNSNTLNRPRKQTQNRPIVLMGLQITSVPVDVHYRKQKLCRAPEPLPRVKKRALGKACLCLEHHSVKQKTRQTALCRVPGTRHRKALGNDNFAESWALGILRHSAKHSYVVQAVIFAESPTRDARRRYNFAESGP
jgi:hypothetical protein